MDGKAYVTMITITVLALILAYLLPFSVVKEPDRETYNARRPSRRLDTED